ncbi:Rna polymerase sigma factor siga [Thalictrum thalictroides]|uniref:Rna polymerase sigma factor siga n=1 Tax=Thalictrum thalictroides TaxID=46969 RepID=A0A7J6UWP7_THATH|nr:Rna polymerase sigma factor siga [Thalictrum thalictroides]
MATAAVIGVSAGKHLLSSSLYYSDITDKLHSVYHDHGLIQYQTVLPIISAKKSTHFGPSFPHDQHTKAIQEHVNALAAAASVTAETVSLHKLDSVERGSFDFESSTLEALLLLQKSMLEKQWNLSFERKGVLIEPIEQRCKKVGVINSGISARQRRSMRKYVACNSNVVSPSRNKNIGSTVSPDLLGDRSKSYVKGVLSVELLTHAEVVHLSKKIKAGLSLEDYKSRLKKRLGYTPSDEQLATSLKISRAELRSKLIECSLARERLAMSNVRLVISIAQKYENMGAEMADLVQGGLIGLVRGIEKFDSSKGFKISTYVYWWIRQGVSRALIENSRTLRLPTHLHERLSLIRNAKIRLEDEGITPSIERIAESLNMSQKKVRNATEQAISKVFSLDREAFPSLNGLPGETLHSYIADTRLENNPWHGIDEWTLKVEVNNLIKTTLREREQDIVRLYYGLDKECLTWEDISKRIGLSRERVRQVGLVALEKLKHAARRKKLEAMLVKH